eukprot:TRINITY_DN1115_c0_g1_i1.p1 TRINITY_DN1115_c0_g1~~TRINITY_DN1115_c0_g1_i1.p1  ORF type:complete len:399 (+),score=104.30 TRINITY_DN1115_c0_g1_i1:103-1299(+)
MGKTKAFILLDQPVYVCKTQLTGRLELVVDDPITCSGIDLSLKVYERVSSDSKKSADLQKIWSENTIPLWRPDKESYEMRSGVHAFPFAVPIPDGGPSSFDSRSQEVAYLLQAFVFEKESVVNVETSRNVLVVENLRSDNAREKVGAPSVAEGKKRLLFGGAKKLQARLQSNKSVFSAGEPIFLAIEVSNQTKKKVRGFRMELKRVIEVQTPSLRKIKMKTVAKKEFRDRDYVIYAGVDRHILLDFLAPFGLWSITQAELFSVKYVLTVSVITPWSRNLSVDLPLRLVHPASYNSVFFPDISLHPSSDVPPMSPRLEYEVTYGADSEDGGPEGHAPESPFQDETPVVSPSAPPMPEDQVYMYPMVYPTLQGGYGHEHLVVAVPVMQGEVIEEPPRKGE